MEESKRKRWMGNSECDICGRTPRGWFVDGRTVNGPWAVMCQLCFRIYGVGLGVGRGQKYDAVPPYYKLEG